MSNVESIKKALEGVTPERVERLWWFLHILSKSSGTTNADDDKWNWINAFCTDYEDDTFNSAKNIGFISVTHNDLMETSTARLTDPGKAFVAYFDKAPSASANTTLEALQRENEALRANVRREAELATHMDNDCSNAQAEVNRLRGPKDHAKDCEQRYHSCTCGYEAHLEKIASEVCQ